MELRVRLRDEQLIIKKALAELVLRGKFSDREKLRAIELYKKIDKQIK